jgi:hypothetical protein
MREPNDGPNLGPKHVVVSDRIFHSLLTFQTRRDNHHQIDNAVARSTRKPRQRREGNMKMDLREIGRVYLPICWLHNDVVYKLVNPSRCAV